MARKPGPLLAPRHKVWLTLDGEFLPGPNYLRFLRAVEESGSIRAAGHLLAVFADWREEMHRLAGRAFAAALRRHPGPARRRG